MKKYILLLFLIFNVFSVYSQKAVDAMYVTYKDDTVHTKVIYKVFAYDGVTVNPMSFQGRIHILDEKGKNTVKEADVKYLELDFQDGKRVFVSSLFFPELKLNNKLYEKIITGKLNWFQTYYYDAYNHVVNTVEHYFLTGQSPLSVGKFGNIKKTLRDLVAVERPDLIPSIDNISRASPSDRQMGITNVVTAYNSN